MNIDKLNNRLRTWFLTYRKEKELTQGQFADKAEICHKHYGEFENTQTKCRLSMWYFLKICYHHGLKPWVVLELALGSVWGEKT
ncbi:MAG: hypothetical protein IPP77_10555 [Bacteroidetes bacterium]|nr:hypothetical protein [Bacteroidota bacterium]